MSSPLEKVEYLPRTKCPLHEEFHVESLRLQATVYDKVTRRSFRILRCPCGVGLTDPYPSEETVKYLYEGRTSVSNFDPIRGTVMDKIKDAFARRDIRFVHKMAGSPRVESVLDFGAGHGRFSLASNQCFPDAEVDSVDFDSEPPPMLQHPRPGMRYLPLEAFLTERKKYDLIILRAVLEHVHEPIPFLRMLTQRLKPEGVLYVDAPNIDSAYIHYFGSRINGYAVPYHLFNFDSASMQRVIESAGLQGKLFQKGLPLAGCVLASLLKQERSLLHQLAGIALHPLQWLLELIKGKYILAAVCKKRVPAR